MKALSLVLVLCASVSMAADKKVRKTAAETGSSATVNTYLNNKDSAVPSGSSGEATVSQRNPPWE